MSRRTAGPAARGASADAVPAYLRRIGKIALLDAAQEVELARRIEAGLFAAERLHRLDQPGSPPTPGSAARPTGDQLRDLHDLVCDGERARDRLMEANLRLVVSIAKRYIGRGLAFLDLIRRVTWG